MEFVPAILLFLVAYLISARFLFMFFQGEYYTPFGDGFTVESILIFVPVLNTLILMAIVILLLLSPIER